MCGRYAATTSPERLTEIFHAVDARPGDRDEQARYNVAPSALVHTVATHDNQRLLGMMRWGFVPRWASRVGAPRQPINARLETITSSKMFSASWRTRRCLVPADAYYEWHDPGGGQRKQPYAIRAHDGQPMAFAGIWTTWRPAQPPPDNHGSTTDGDRDDGRVVSMAVVTTAAQGPAAKVHDRMPLIVPEALWTPWLACDDDNPYLFDAVSSATPPLLEVFAVSTKVNVPTNDGPDLLDRLDASAI